MGMPTAQAQQSYTLGLNGSSEVEELFLPVGKSQIIESDQPLSQVVVGNPGVANVQLLNEDQFLVVGQSPGITNLAFSMLRGSIKAIKSVCREAISRMKFYKCI